MSFVLPSFPLVCGVIHSGAIIPGGPYDLTPVCNLTWGRRTQVGSVDLLQYQNPPASSMGTMTILFPPLTDVRDYACSGSFDSIECPLGSGRWYWVLFVDDIGKGFANEHRAALVTKAALLAPPWPIPIP